MINPGVHLFETTEKLLGGFTDYFIDLVQQKAGDFHLALSGGSTPKIWFEELAENHQKDIPWGKIHFYWGDERCVPPDDEQSNFGMTKKYLFDHLPVPAENIHRIPGELDPELAAEKYASVLTELLPSEIYPVFDLVMLGMGDDGHTASIFPYQIELWNADKLCVVAQHPDTGQQRVSLSGRVINSAQNIAFLVTGENKAEKVREIIRKKPVASHYPASLVQPKSGQLSWFLDRSAGQML